MNYKVWTKEDIIEVLNKASRKANYPCSIPVTISKTLTVTGGYFQAIFEKDTWGNIKYIKADKFTFSYYYLNGVLHENDVEQLILHEYCHFLTIDNTGEDHGHDELFKENCRLLGCLITGDGELHCDIDNSPYKYKYTITCKKCNNVFGENRIKKNYTDLYCCEYCGSSFKIRKNW